MSCEDEMRVEELVEIILSEGATLAPPIPIDGRAPMEFTSEFAPSGVPKEEIQRQQAGIPQDLIDFWTSHQSARLFEDRNYGQWGLVIFSPDESASSTREFFEERRSDARVGDLVVGEFLGDSDLLLVRCDCNQEDYAEVIVALPLDPREEWYRVSKSFLNFLSSFGRCGGKKFWVDSP